MSKSKSEVAQYNKRKRVCLYNMISDGCDPKIMTLQISPICTIINCSSGIF